MSVMHVKTTRRLSKLQDIGKVMVFIGYELYTKAYSCLNYMTYKVYISKDMVFREWKIGDSRKVADQSGDFHFSSLSNLTRDTKEGPSESNKSNPI